MAGDGSAAKLTVLAARFHRHSGDVASNLGSIFHLLEAIGARVARAAPPALTALVLRARVVVALDSTCVRDWNKPVTARDGVAVGVLR